ncbi:hypothetical protein ACFL6C_08415 [Myxococcota bacterium]
MSRIGIIAQIAALLAARQLHAQEHTETCVQAEDGAVTNPMQAIDDTMASGGQYVTSSSDGAGALVFAFDIQAAGDHLLYGEVRGGGADLAAHDSFYVGFDGEPAENSGPYVWDTARSSVFVWDHVRLRGDNGDPTTSEFDPKTWTLDVGMHSLSIYGRESGTHLDRIVLMLCPDMGCDLMSPAHAALLCGGITGDGGPNDGGSNTDAGPSSDGQGTDEFSGGDSGPQTDSYQGARAAGCRHGEYYDRLTEACVQPQSPASCSHSQCPALLTCLGLALGLCLRRHRRNPILQTRDR